MSVSEAEVSFCSAGFLQYAHGGCQGATEIDYSLPRDSLAAALEGIDGHMRLLTTRIPRMSPAVFDLKLAWPHTCRVDVHGC